MSGVRQTDFTPTKGNALQACIATILHVDLDSVPNFIALPGPDIYQHVREFLARHGLGFIKIMLDEQGQMPFYPGDVKCLVAGQSPRGSHRHVVVAEFKQGKLIHVFDPHPSDEFLSGVPLWVGLFVSMDPSSCMNKDS
jgi:hypothetical protein